MFLSAATQVKTNCVYVPEGATAVINLHLHNPSNMDDPDVYKWIRHHSRRVRCASCSSHPLFTPNTRVALDAAVGTGPRQRLRLEELRRKRSKERNPQKPVVTQQVVVDVSGQQRRTSPLRICVVDAKPYHSNPRPLEEVKNIYRFRHLFEGARARTLGFAIDDAYTKIRSISLLTRTIHNNELMSDNGRLRVSLLGPFAGALRVAIEVWVQHPKRPGHLHVLREPQLVASCAMF